MSKIAIRLCGDPEDIKEFIACFSINNEGLEETAIMDIPNSGGQIFQYCKWVNPNR